MKKIFNGFATLIVFTSLFVLSSCSKDDDTLAKTITIDGEKIALSNGYIQGLGVDGDDNGDVVSLYAVFLSSADLTIIDGDTQGSGTAILMQLISPSSIQLKNGTYDINIDESFLKQTAYSIVIKNYDSETDESDAFYEAVSGTIKISSSGETFKITFNLICFDGENEVEVKGSFEGKLEETLLFF